jgi:bifunctional DNase/RNase
LSSDFVVALRREPGTVDLEVAALTADPFTNLPVVILEARGSLCGAVTLPITIGIGEASAIAAELDDIALDRPLAHQLMAEMLLKLGGAVERVELHEAGENVFCATIHIVLPKPCAGGVVALDARASDAIALALRTKAPIRVAREVALRGLAPWAEAIEPSLESMAALSALGDDAFGKWKM